MAMAQNEWYWLEKGTVLAERYRIEDVVSEGGFGIIYIGCDLILDMKVAVKEYFPRRFAMRESGNLELHVYKGAESEKHFRQGLEKFYNEARIQAQFHDLDSIVTVRDFFYENKTAYIINDYVQGINVSEYVRLNGRMEPERVLQLMEPILGSLSKIHSTGLLHRDISPDNIILLGDRAVLIDFGAARTVNIQDDRSITVLFKRGYSAEEQYIRNGRQGPYTDVYAACATMYFMLTGTAPEEAVQRHIKDHVVSLTKQKDIALDFYKKEAIMKGMSVAVESRYPDMKALCDALYGKRGRQFRRQLRLIAVAAVVCLALLCWKAFPLTSAQKDDGRMADAEDSYVEGTSFDGGVFSDERISSGGGISSDGRQPENDSSRMAAKPAKEYRIPDVKEMKKKKAVRKLRQNSPDGLKIHIKKVWHTEKAGKVIGQSVKAGRKYEEGEVREITLRVSRGAKPVSDAGSGQKGSSGDEPSGGQADSGQAGNGKTQTTKEPSNSGTKDSGEKEDGFAGALPW